MVQRILNYFPNYPTHRLYFEEVETPYSYPTMSKDINFEFTVIVRLIDKIYVYLQIHTNRQTKLLLQEEEGHIL